MEYPDPVLIEVPMPIETPRLSIRPKQAGDGCASSEAVSESWGDLHLWMPWAVELSCFTAQQQEIRARYQFADFLLRKEFNLVGSEKETGHQVVWCSLYDIDWTARRCYTGCWVRSSAQGKGIASETINALVRYAFEALGMKRVDLTHSSGNEASRRMAEKVGFILEGIQKAATLLPGGQRADRFIYGLTDTKNLPQLQVTWGCRSSQAGF